MWDGRRRELIRKAVGARLQEVLRERIARLVPEQYGEHADFVKELQAVASHAARQSPPYLYQPAGSSQEWLTCVGDCLEALRALSLGDSPQVFPGSRPALTPFLSSLRARRPGADRQFLLLAERYGCPLNITLAAEQEAREYLLETLMVRDRARLEKSPVATAVSDDLLLKLNLLALHAARSNDLRYLDALNYYYEILHGEWADGGLAPWLYASYLGLYARALSAWLSRETSE
jgi:hypothetical protein